MSDKPTTGEDVMKAAIEKGHYAYSKPATTTGEWTEETLTAYGITDLQIRKDLAKAHNAALAAERERYKTSAFECETAIAQRDMSERANEQLREQLAAEQEQVRIREVEIARISAESIRRREH